MSRWNKITLKKYIKMRLHQKETTKQLSFLKYQKLINKGHYNHQDFSLLKNTSKEAR